MGLLSLDAVLCAGWPTRVCCAVALGAHSIVPCVVYRCGLYVRIPYIYIYTVYMYIIYM